MNVVNPQPEGQAAITGYRLLTDEIVNMINQNKELERDVALQWRWLAGRPDADPRMLNHARTQLQDGFMWLNRALSQPEDPWKVDP